MQDIIERVRTDLAGKKRSEIEAFADDIGVPRGTFRKIVSRETPNPRYSTVRAIEAYYERREQESA
jgi:hypothetical protein